MSLFIFQEDIDDLDDQKAEVIRKKDQQSEKDKEEVHTRTTPSFKKQRVI